MSSGLEYSVETVKSLVISLALMEHHISVDKAAYLSRLELEYQVRCTESCMQARFNPFVAVFFSVQIKHKNEVCSTKT